MSDGISVEKSCFFIKQQKLANPDIEGRSSESNSPAVGCRFPKSTRKKDGQRVGDSDVSELMAAGSQCVAGSGQLAAAAAAQACPGSVGSSTAVTVPAARQQTQTQTKVGRRRVVARFDGRPRRPIQQMLYHSSVNAACGSSPSSISAHQQTDGVNVAESIAVINESASVHTLGEWSRSVLSLAL